jgi:hypothetical protein
MHESQDIKGDILGAAQYSAEPVKTIPSQITTCKQVVTC